MPTCMRRAVLRERGLELGEALLRDAVTNAVVVVHDRRALLLCLGVDPWHSEGRDLGDEPALLLCFGGLLEGRGGEGVLIVARDVEVVCDVLGSDAHRNEAVFRLFAGEHGLREAIGVCPSIVAKRHGFDTGGCGRWSADEEQNGARRFGLVKRL